MPQAKSVSFETRENVQVRMKDLLSGNNTVGKEQIDAFTTNAAPAYGVSQPLGDAKHMCACVHFEIRQEDGMRNGYD